MIKGKNIILRTFRESDLDNFLKLDLDLSKRGEFYIMELTTEPQLKKWYNENGLWNEEFGRMLIVDINNENEILGYINYFKTVSYFEALEIGYILFNENRRGKGIMTEAVNLFVEYLFRSKRINRLEIRAHSENIASQKVAEKCGFKYEGLQRGVCKYNDKYMDMKSYAITRQDFYNK